MRTRAIAILVMIVCLVGLAPIDGVTQENRERVARNSRTAVRATEASEKQEEVHLPVVVETYLVQVDMDALYGFGVAAVAQKDDETVTVPRLVSCLADPDDGRVLDSTRVVMRSREHGQVDITSTEYIRETSTRSGPVPKTATRAVPAQSVRFKAYDSGSTVKVTAYAVRAEYPKIRLELTYSYSGSVLPVTEDGVPRSTARYDQVTILELEDGKAVVAGSKQTGNRGLFLVVRASIVGKN